MPACCCVIATPFRVDVVSCFTDVPFLVDVSSPVDVLFLCLRFVSLFAYCFSVCVLFSMFSCYLYVCVLFLCLRVVARFACCFSLYQRVVLRVVCLSVCRLIAWFLLSFAFFMFGFTTFTF